MADNDVEGQFNHLIALLRSGAWQGLWESLHPTVLTFSSVGLGENTSDLEVWRTCQSQGIVLFTGNRNMESPDSLENTLRLYNQANSLPVITLSDVNRFNHDRDYSLRVAVKFMEFLVYLDEHRGAGRLFVP